MAASRAQNSTRSSCWLGRMSVPRPSLERRGSINFDGGPLASHAGEWAAFISHCKDDAAMDARWLQEKLEAHFVRRCRRELPRAAGLEAEDGQPRRREAAREQGRRPDRCRVEALVGAAADHLDRALTATAALALRGVIERLQATPEELETMLGKEEISIALATRPVDL